MQFLLQGTQNVSPALGPCSLFCYHAERAIFFELQRQSCSERKGSSFLLTRQETENLLMFFRGGNPA